MSRKALSLICVLFLVLSSCAVEAKKKKNVGPRHFGGTLPVLFAIFPHACDQPKSDVEKMKENCIQVLAIYVVVVVAVEVANYFLSYRRPSFGATVLKLINAVRDYAARATLL